MKIKLINNVLGAAVAAFLAGLLYVPSVSHASNHIRPTGKTTEQSSQLVFWYDEDDTGSGALSPNRDTLIQVTNASVDTPVWVHVQIFASSNTSPGDPTTAVICSETNFNDFYTPLDTHIFTMDNVVRNDPLDPGNEVVDLQNTKGFIVITPIDGPGTRNAISHQHMFGYSFVSDGLIFGYMVSSMGRDAVSFTTGAVVADGTVLDGVANGYVLLQPDILKFTYSGFGGDFNDFADLVSIAFKDNYEGVFGYVAEPADATWTPLIFDEDENPISCSTVTQNCFFDIGLNDDGSGFGFLQANVLLGDQLLCPGNGNIIGWTKIAVGGLEGLENELGLLGTTYSDEGYSGAVWMHVE